METNDKLCENCVYSGECTILKPCKDYVPSIKSNFMTFMEEDVMINKNDIEKLRFFDNEDSYFDNFEDFS